MQFNIPGGLELIDSTIWRPVVVSLHGDYNGSFGTGASWLIAPNGVTQTNITVVAEKQAEAISHQGILYPAGECYPVTPYDQGDATPVDVITDLYQEFTPPFEVR